MASQLIEIVTAEGVPAGGTVVIPHHINVDGNAKIPDWISRDNMGFAGIACDDENVTVRNDTDAEADIELYLFYDHTIQRVYGDKAVLQLSPAPFWIGGAGSSVASAGVIDEFVYQPGGAAAGPSVFASFPDLYTAMVAARVAAGGNIPITLGYDSSLGAVTVPAGTYNFTNVTEVGVGNGAQVAVSYADGTVFTGQRRWKNLIVTNLNTTTPPNTDAANGDMFFLDRATLMTTTAVVVPLIQFGVTGTFTMWLANGSAIGGAQTGRVVGITGAPAKHLVVALDSSSSITSPTTTLVGGAGADLVIQAPGMSQVPIVTSWTSAAANPVLEDPASFRPNPYLGGASNVAVTAAHGQYIRLDGTSLTQPLPAIGAAAVTARGAGVPLVIENVNATAVTLTANGADTIGTAGATSLTVPPATTVVLVSDGVSRWTVVVDPASAVAVPQKLISPHWDGADGTVVVDNNLARGFLMGYAARDLAAGESFRVAWRNVVAAVSLTWGEIAVATGLGNFVAGDAGINLTAVGFADVSAGMGSAATNFQSALTLPSKITKGSAIWAIIAAANTGSAPTVTSGPIDTTGSGLAVTCTTAGYRPSTNLGVAAAFLTDITRQIPKQVWSI